VDILINPILEPGSHIKAEIYGGNHAAIRFISIRRCGFRMMSLASLINRCGMKRIADM